MTAIAQSGIHTGVLGTSIATVGAVVTAGKQQRISYIRVTNTSASARTVDVSLYDGTNHHYLCKGYPLTAMGAAGSVIDVTPGVTYLPAGWTISALASATTSLELVAPYLETSI